MSDAAGTFVDRREEIAPPRPPRRSKEHRAARILPVVAWTLISVCVLTFAASLAVPLWFQLQDQRLLIVTSGSMAPYFNAGDAVVMQNITDPSQLQVGQVASFWPPGSDSLVTHRIVDLTSLPVLELDESTGSMVPTLDEATGLPIMQPYIVTQGDANPNPDPDATPLGRVRGVVLEVYPQWGQLLGWAHSPQGRFVMLAPPLLLLVVMEVASLVRARRNRTQDGQTPRPEEMNDAYLLD